VEAMLGGQAGHSDHFISDKPAIPHIPLSSAAQGRCVWSRPEKRSSDQWARSSAVRSGSSACTGTLAAFYALLHSVFRSDAVQAACRTSCHARQRGPQCAVFVRCSVHAKAARSPVLACLCDRFDVCTFCPIARWKGRCPQTLSSHTSSSRKRRAKSSAAWIGCGRRRQAALGELTRSCSPPMFSLVLGRQTRPSRRRWNVRGPCWTSDP
jgi:hypothetical protein